MLVLTRSIIHRAVADFPGKPNYFGKIKIPCNMPIFEGINSESIKIFIYLTTSLSNLRHMQSIETIIEEEETRAWHPCDSGDPAS